jgi:group I intron endonuclease
MLLKPARSKKAPRSELPLRRGAEIPSPPRKRPSSCRPTAARIPRASGIYRIVCKPTGQFYVGSAVNLHERLRSHWTALRRGKHANKYLQRAWKRYREVNFEFKVVELVKPSRLLAAEQSWLNKTRCIDRNIGFNILPHALSSSSLTARTWKGFFDPRGRPVSIKNLHKFCRENRLCFAAMAQLHHGKSKLKSYKGWTHKNSVRQRDYIKTHTGFIRPDGERVGKIVNLHAFSRKHGLSASHMIAVAHGRIVSHRGWTHSEGREALTPKKHTGFIRPDGRPTVIINLARFCRESGLSVVHMHNLKSGIRRIHKGWTWRGA